MTKKEALKLFQDHKYMTDYSFQDEMSEIAIRSLKAWEEVLTELEEKAAFADCCGDMEEKLGIKSAINIINQKLAEIEE